MEAVNIIDEIKDAPAQPSQAELMRGIHLQAAGVSRRIAAENEKRLKGLQVDWIFEKLNLTKYR